MKKKWEIFERECVAYLIGKYGPIFELKGKSDSTVSDILVNGKNEDNPFYIEVKMHPSQSGQFVVEPDFKRKQFQYSDRNKTLENQYSQLIMKFMDERFECFCAPGTKGKIIDISKNIIYGWILDHYKKKKVKFFITRNNNEFIIFPTRSFAEYFDVVAKYRVKTSGSSDLTDAYKEDAITALNKAGIKYQFEGLDIISDDNLNDVKVCGAKRNYLLREENSRYKVKKLSNTKNRNVIFSIKLKKYSDAQRKQDLREFEETIGIRIAD